jgi:hypothetical protein
MIPLRTFALATLAALGTAAWAGDAPAADGKHHELRAKLLEKFDANHDGRLDEGERAAAKAALKERRGEHHGELKAKVLAKFDADHDGKLDEAERAAARAALKERRAAHHGKDGGAQ